jgi:hypothetical protein
MYFIKAVLPMYPLEDWPASAGINAKRSSLLSAMLQNLSDEFSAF